jgi:kinesin family protein 18/19
MRRHSIGVTTRRAAAIVQEEPVQATEEEPNMLVAVRVRPLSMQEKDKDIRSCCNVLNGKIVAIKKEGDPSGYLRSQMPTINDYGFDAAFDEDSTQKEVYEGTAKRFIPNVIKGLNVTVFAYGATGAGKTHTMLGNTRADETSAAAEAGVIPQAVFDLFDQLDAKKAAVASAVGGNSESYSVIVSFVEIYNEQG